DQVADDGAVVGRVEARAAAERVEELLDGGAVALALRRERPRRVELARAETGRRSGDATLLVVEPDRERVPERVGRVRREEEDPPPRVGLGEGGRRRRRAGRLPDAALTAEEEEPERRRGLDGEEPSRPPSPSLPPLRGGSLRRPRRRRVQPLGPGLAARALLE